MILYEGVVASCLELQVKEALGSTLGLQSATYSVRSVSWDLGRTGGHKLILSVAGGTPNTWYKFAWGWSVWCWSMLELWAILAAVVSVWIHFFHIFSYSFHHFSGLTMMTNHGQQLSGKICRFQLVQCQCGVGCVALCCCMSFYIGDGNSRTTEFLYLCDMRYSGSLVFVLAVRMNRKRVLVLFAFNWSFRIVRIQTCNIIQLYYTCNILIIIEFYWSIHSIFHIWGVECTCAQHHSRRVKQRRKWVAEICLSFFLSARHRNFPGRPSPFPCISGYVAL